MTIRARPVAISCLLLALLAGFGSARGEPWKRYRPERTYHWPALPPLELFGDSDAEAEYLEGCDGWTDPGCSCWTVTAEALMLQRTAAESLDILFRPALIPPDVVALNVADLDFDFQAGPRISLIYRPVCDCQVEATYFGIDGWNSRAVREGNPLILFPPGVLISSQFTVDYGSDLYSAELHLRQQCGRRFDFLVGLRWVELREGFHVVGPNPLPGPTLRYDTETENSMYGFQIGTAAMLVKGGGPLRLDGFLKAGIYDNNAFQESSSVGNLGGVVRARDRRDHTAFVGEVGLTGKYLLGEYLTLRGGYQVMWIEGVALAPDQIPTTDVSPASPGIAVVETGGSLFYHGFHVGLEARW